MNKGRGKKFFVIPLVCLALTAPLLFTTADNKIYDLFLRFLPSLTEHEKVYVLTLDDDSINYAGGFPFRREVMADVVLLLRELGAASVTFDLSYLDESPQRLDRDYAREVFSRYLDEGFGSINETAAQVIDGFATGAIGRGEGEIYKDEFITLNSAVRSELEKSLEYLTQDVDEYFAQALEFTRGSYLTLTMISAGNILSGAEKIPEPDEAMKSLLESRIALKNIAVHEDLRTPEMAGVMPAIYKLLSRTAGAGFVNADADPDGIRRRVNLLVKYRGTYYGHLALVGMRNLLGNPAIEVSGKEIVLRNAKINGRTSDIRIPRTERGAILLKWPKKAFYEYRVMSLLELIQHTIIEKVFAENLSLMASSGFFTVWEGDGRGPAQNPWELFNLAEDLRAEGAALEEWLAMRRDFFKTAGDFLEGPYEERILEMVAGDEETSSFVEELFKAAHEQFRRMRDIRANSSAALDGAFCVIGADATSMTDNGITPFEENYPNVGTYAVMANMLLSGEFLDDAPVFVSIVLALIFSFGIALLTGRLATGRSIPAGACVLAALTGLSLLYFRVSKQYIGLALPFASSTLTFLSVLVINFLGTSREKTFLHMAFSRYLSPSIINEIIADPDKLNLGGEKREMTAVFTDIQGFSTISEQLDPVQLVRLLNRYLTAMSNIIMENLGTIDKYEGDAIIAFFGAPVYREDHAALACRSALEIKKAERELNAVIMEEGLSPSPLFTRIGVNTGEMVVGNMGAENKMDYTIMGSAVNLASRLEGVNKQYHTGGILISGSTKAKIGDEFICRSLDRVRVVGINTPVRLYELLDLREDTDAGQAEYLAAWEKAIGLFEQGFFAQAGELFSLMTKKMPQDNTAKLYAEWCINYIDMPPDNWDGVHNLREK
ncbi:MAG: CHASE2 domain-containing protein [Spirochaetaceae bacterium]|jgi:adenylate cyclase|nr:CHASE2 domain-containing protein [Spirochaetaceae bacterium]